MASISGTILALAAVAAASAASATTSSISASKARSQAKKQQKEQLAAAEAAANKSTAATVSNTGDVDLESEESLEDEATRNKSKKNRLRVDKTGLSLGTNTGAKSSTGLSI